VLLAHLAARTTTIRLGSGGVMLPNHAPMVVAEQFGTLAALHPGRIDLGLGRAPGADQRTMRALRRDPASADSFPQDVLELQAFLSPVQPGQRIQAVPGAGLDVPLWILGSSLFGAQLAAELGLPYAFASHFMPDALMDALDVYRTAFKPSAQLERPHAMAGINVFAADTDAEARRIFTSAQQQFTNLLRGTPGRLPPPIDDIERYWSPIERAQASARLAMSFVGSRETVAPGLAEFIEMTGVEEIIVASMIYDHTARVRSYEILADVIARL
jgi:luciferase family oxidoreductase group 1